LLPRVAKVFRVDLRHPLAALAARMPWDRIETARAPIFAHKTRPGKTMWATRYSERRRRLRRQPPQRGGLQLALANVRGGAPGSGRFFCALGTVRSFGEISPVLARRVRDDEKLWDGFCRDDDIDFLQTRRQRQFPGQRVFAATGTNNEEFHDFFFQSGWRDILPERRKGVILNKCSWMF
jgi:hypothetical protein